MTILDIYLHLHVFDDNIKGKMLDILRMDKNKSM